MCGNRVEELESRVKELEASVEGLTDEPEVLVDGVLQLAQPDLALDEFVREPLHRRLEFLDSRFEFLDSVATHMSQRRLRYHKRMSDNVIESETSTHPDPTPSGESILPDG